MTRKQFLKQMGRVKDRLTEEGYEAYTCNVVRYHSEAICKLYRVYIGRFTTAGTTLLDDAYSESDCSRSSIRILLIDSFIEECLRTKIYKEIK